MAELLNPAVVMDCGTGYTKLGFAGNTEPSWVLPTAVGFPAGSHSGSGSTVDGMVYCIGDEAIRQAHVMEVVNPMKQGTVENWDYMERFWEQCIWSYLRVNPEEHNFLLSEPPLNPPHHRELTAEIMFETFNVAGLHIGVQAELALYGGYDDSSVALGGGTTTGTVVEGGEGVCHVLPVVDGYVLHSAVKWMPLAGKDITAFVQQLMRDRGEAIPPDAAFETARAVKQRFGYVCSDMVKEFKKYDANPGKYFGSYTGQHPKGGAFTCDVGYERFLGPEILFNPEIYTSDYRTPLPALVDAVIQKCPIDSRRALYGNIVLSGGSTLFKDFNRRLQRDIKRLVDRRLVESATKLDVKVKSSAHQRHAVWFGGSVMAGSPAFSSNFVTRSVYSEYGPSACRMNINAGNT